MQGVTMIKVLLKREVQRRIALLRNPTDNDIVNIVASAFNELMARNLNCGRVGTGRQ